MKFTIGTFALAGAISLTLMGASLPVNAQIINSSDTGWYNSSGFHDSANKNYIAGENTYNDYFVFDLTNVNAPISSATFSAVNPIVGFQGSHDTFTLHKVNTSISTLEASHSAAVGIHNDLGSGTVFGSVSVSSADNGTNVTVHLDNAAINYINANLGSSIAFGGTLGTTSDYVFGFTNTQAVNQGTLTLTPAATPEPGSIAMLVGMSLSGAGFLIRRRRKTR